jgi:hypothetical protein
MYWPKVILLCLPLFVGKAKHEFHSSIAEMHYNMQSKSLEVSIRVFSDDFTLALNEANGTNLTEETLISKDAEKAIQQYIVRHFSLVDNKKNVKVGKVIGSENELDATWLYIEFFDCENLNSFTLFNSILTEIFDDQTNVVNVIYPHDKKSLIFTKEKKGIPFPF